MPVQLIPPNGSPLRGINAISARNQVDSPFLCLPNELRNQIYEYALSEPEGLHYRFAGNKAPRLFSKVEASPKENGPPFSLEANQLKYACRQLWHETKGYGLKFNALNFTQTDPAHPHAADQAVAFMSGISSQRMKWLRHVKIGLAPNLEKQKWARKRCRAQAIEPHDHEKCLEERQAGYHSIIPLLKFAHLHPQITFDVTITLPPHECDYHVPDTWYLLNEICMHLIAFRGKEQELLERRFWFYEKAEEQAKGMWRKNEELAVLNAPNVRFRFPIEWLDEEEIREDCFTADDLEWVEDEFEGGVDGFVECLRGWAENGF